MPNVHVRISHITRGTNAGSAARALAYITRVETGAQQRETVVGRSLRAEGKPYGEDLITVLQGHLPDWAHDNALAYFAAADAYEGQNRRLASVVVVGLPRTLPRAEQGALLQDFCDSQWPVHPYVAAIHETTAADGLPHPHAHIIYSERITDGIARTPAEHFRLYQPQHPDRGGAQKDPELHQIGRVKAMRVAYTDLANMALDQAGSAERYDPRPFTEQGITRRPARAVAPYHAIAAKYRGITTAAWASILEERARSARQRPTEEALAREYWEHRKGEGYAVVSALSRAERVAYVAAQTRRDAAPHGKDHALVPVTARVREQWQDHLARIEGEIVRHEVYAATGRTPTPGMDAAATRLVARGRQLGWTLPEEDHDGGTHYRAGRDGYER